MGSTASRRLLSSQSASALARACCSRCNSSDISTPFLPCTQSPKYTIQIYGDTPRSRCSIIQQSVLCTLGKIEIQMIENGIHPHNHIATPSFWRLHTRGCTWKTVSAFLLHYQDTQFNWHEKKIPVQSKFTTISYNLIGSCQLHLPEAHGNTWVHKSHIHNALCRRSQAPWVHRGRCTLVLRDLRDFCHPQRLQVSTWTIKCYKRSRTGGIAAVARRQPAAVRMFTHPSSAPLSSMPSRAMSTSGGWGASNTSERASLRGRSMFESKWESPRAKQNVTARVISLSIPNRTHPSQPRSHRAQPPTLPAPAPTAANATENTQPAASDFQVGTCLEAYDERGCWVEWFGSWRH